MNDKKALGNNPFLQNVQEKKPHMELTDEEANQIRAIQVSDWTTICAKVHAAKWKKLKNYAYTNRLEIKEALDQALDKFLDDIDDKDLLDVPDRPKRGRKKGGKA